MFVNCFFLEKCLCGEHTCWNETCSSFYSFCFPLNRTRLTLTYFWLHKLSSMCPYNCYIFQFFSSLKSQFNRKSLDAQKHTIYSQLWTWLTLSNTCGCVSPCANGTCIIILFRKKIDESNALIMNISTECRLSNKMQYFCCQCLGCGFDDDIRSGEFK